MERLADVGEEAIQRIGGAPGADRALKALTTMRDRVDDLQRRVRGLEGLEKRVLHRQALAHAQAHDLGHTNA